VEPEPELPRLTGVSVRGLFGRHSVDLPLDGSSNLVEPRLRIIFDDNGRGKTTVLRCIHHLLSWSDLDFHLNGLAELPVEKVTLRLEDNVVSFERAHDDPRSCRVLVETEDRSETVEYEFGRDDPRGRARLVLDQRNAAAYRQLMSDVCLTPVFISDDRMIHGDDVLPRRPTTRQQRLQTASGAVMYASQHDPARSPREPAEELRELLDHLAQVFLQAAFGARTTGQEAVYADVVRRIANDNVQDPGDVRALMMRAQQIEKRLRLAASYGLVNLSQLKSVKTTLSTLRQNSRNKKFIATVLDPFFTTLEADAARLDPVAQSVDQFVSTVNKFLADKTMEFMPREGLRLLPFGYGADRVPLETSQLSSGERHLLLLFGSALIAEGRRLILIDEPELSLGIAWKRMLLQSLLDLTETSQTQFLIASHSVEIISPFRGNAIQLRATAAQRLA
jgi:ABC-type branched-subunit amino acid transport system ATPase component